MAYYTDLGDGSFEVETDDGRKLTTAMDPSALGIEQKPANVQQFDDANRMAKNTLTIPTLAGSYRNASASDANPVTESIGQPGVTLTDREPAKTLPVQRSGGAAQGQSPSGQPSNKIDAMQSVIESQILKRSAPRKAGEVPVSRTVQQAPTPTEEDVSKIEASEQAADQTAYDERAKLVQQRNDLLESELYRQQDNEVKLLEAADRREKINAEMMKLQQYAEQKEREASEIRDLSPSDEFFKNSGGAWGRVLAGIVTLIGGLGAAHSAAAGQVTPNQGLESIKRGIEEQAQKLKAEHEQREAAGQTARNAYSQALAVYGTPEAATEALRLQGEAIAERKLAILTEQYKGPEELSALQVQMAQNQAQRAERRANLNAQRIGTVQKSYRYDPGSAGGVSVDPKMLGLWGDLEKLKTGDGKAPKANELAVRLPNGAFVYADSPETKKKSQEQIKVDGRIAEEAKRIIHLRNQPGAQTDPKKRAQIEAAVAGLFIGLKAGANLGTLDKGSLEFKDEWMGNPNDIITLGGADAKLAEIAGAAESRVNDTVRYDLREQPGSLTPAQAMPPSSTRPDE